MPAVVVRKRLLLLEQYALLLGPDLAELVASPLVGRDDAGKAFAALGPALNLDPIFHLNLPDFHKRNQ